MTFQMQKAIIQKDLRGIATNKRLFPALLIVPVIFAVFLPTVFILSILFSPTESSDFQQLLQLLPNLGTGDLLKQNLIAYLLNSILPLFFIIIPVMAASVMSASSFVGEKEKRTLETLLYSPLCLKSIFQAKVLASFLLSFVVTVGAFALMVLVVELQLYLILGVTIWPGLNWLITLLLVSPAISLIAVTLIVRGSAKAQTMEESQQKAVFLIMPVILLVLGQFTGVLLLSSWMLLALGILCATIAGLLLKNALHRFTYEELLR